MPLDYTEFAWRVANAAGVQGEHADVRVTCVEEARIHAKLHNHVVSIDLEMMLVVVDDVKVFDVVGVELKEKANTKTFPVA